MRMEDRQRMDQDILTRELPALHESPGVRGEVLVAEHGALRAPSRAGRVEQRCKIVWPARHVAETAFRAACQLRERSVALLAKRFELRAVANYRGDRRLLIGRADDQA